MLLQQVVTMILSNKPSIPSDTGDLTNNAGFITENDIPELPSNTDLSNYDNTTSKFVNETDLASKQDIIDSTHKLNYGYLILQQFQVLLMICLMYKLIHQH